MSKYKTVHSHRGSALPFRKSRLAVAIAAASGITAMPPVFAQEPAGASPAIEEVIVTARKREANIQDTPVSIQAFTADDLIGSTSIGSRTSRINRLRFRTSAPGQVRS